MKSKASRDWLWAREVRKNHDNLTDDEINWILDKEGDNETLLLKWRPATESQQPLARRRPQQRQLREGKWYIRDGNYITLAELFWLGSDCTTCWHLYKHYLQLDMYIHRRSHSMSQTELAKERDNARHLMKEEHGIFALPAKGGRWDPPPPKYRRR